MVNNLKTYYDFAENDYQFFKAAYEGGLVGNKMGAMAQEICEKYLKHLIDEYVSAEHGKEFGRKLDVLRTHNLNKLAKYIEEELPEVELDKESLSLLNGLYFTTRYPGDESILIEEDDIPELVEAVENCKESVDDYITMRIEREER